MKIYLWIILLLVAFEGHTQSYRIGEVVRNEHGETGIIFWLSPDGDYGWATALDDISAPNGWGPDVNIPDLVDHIYVNFHEQPDTAGYSNTDIIRKFLGVGIQYPAQTIDFDKGWYIPAREQLMVLCAALPNIKSALLRNGGTAFTAAIYFSSTESSASQVWSMEPDNTYKFWQTKTEQGAVRPVFTFKTVPVLQDTTLKYLWNTGEQTPDISSVPSQTMEYIVQVETGAGCRSSAAKTIFVADGRKDTIHAVICNGEVYKENGFNENSTGVYTETVPGPGGCDVSVTLKLTVLQPVMTYLSGIICEGEVYALNNFYEAEAGIHIQRWQRPGLCDSVVELDLQVISVPRDTIYDEVCYGSDYTDHGFSISDVCTSATYTEVFASSQGCDSVVTLILDVLPVFRKDIFAEVCYGEDYTDHGFSISGLTASGFYSRTIPGSNGCDSILELYITVRSMHRLNFSGSVCAGKSYSGNDFSVPSSLKDTVVRLSFIDQSGCDSVRILDLKVHPVYNIEIHDTVNKGTNYSKYGVVYNDIRSDQYYHVSDLTSAGCDSLFTLYVVVAGIYDTLVYDTICYRNDYTDHGFYLSGVINSGRHHRIIGQDSTMTLDLTVFPVYTPVIYDTVCFGENYTSHGFNIINAQKNDTATLPLSTTGGCDSLVTLYLTVYPVYDTVIYDTACQGDIYNNGAFYSPNVQTDDVIRLSLQSVNGCDSVATLYLRVNPSYFITYYDTICQGDDYTLYGFSLSNVEFGGTYCQNNITIEGCDYIFCLELEVTPAYVFNDIHEICAGSTYSFRGRELENSGIYYDSLLTVTGCDSIYRLDLHVYPVYNDTIEGFVCDGERYIANGFDVEEAGSHTLYLHSSAGCDSTVTLNLRTGILLEGIIYSELEDCSTRLYRFGVEVEDESRVLPGSLVWTLGDRPEYALWGNGREYNSWTIAYSYVDSGLYQVGLRLKTLDNCENRYEYIHEVPYYLQNISIRTDRQVIDVEYPWVEFRVEDHAGHRYEWDFGDGIVDTGANVRHIYEVGVNGFAEEYEVVLRVFNPEECETEERLLIRSLLAVDPPNTFTPNGDGINDVFMPNYKIRISNRNGIKIYEGNNGWDGTHNGKRAPEDIYFYHLEYEGVAGKRTKAGYINLMR